MKLLHSVPAGNSSDTFFLPKGQYGTFFVQYDVIAAAGVTLDRSNFGNIILNWNGQDVVNVDVEIINLLDNVYGGTSKFTSAVGAGASMSAFLTAGMWFDSSNVYDIGGNDKVYIKLDFPELADPAKVVSGQVKIYAKNKDGIMNYLHNITARPVPSTGVSTLADSFPVNNVTQVYLKDPASLTSNLQIVKDGLTLVDAPPDELISYSDFIHQLETTSNTLAIDFVESRSLAEAVGSTISYKYTFTGAGTLQQYFSFIDFTPAKANESGVNLAKKQVPILPPSGTAQIDYNNPDKGKMTQQRAQDLIAKGLF